MDIQKLNNKAVKIKQGNKRKKLVYILLFLILLPLMTACSNNSQNIITVALDYTPNTNHTGLYIAQKLKYYKEQGLSVNIIQSSKLSTEELVNSGKADIGISYQENLLAADANGMNLKAIYAIQSHNTSGFISQKKKNIVRPKNFNNKTYCGFGGAVEEEVVKELNQEDGGNPQSIKFITNTNSNILDINNKTCDIYWEFEAWGVLEAQNMGVTYNYLPLTKYQKDWYTPIIIAKNDNLKNNPQKFKNFIKATKRGYQYAINNPEKAANVLIKENPELEKKFILKSQQIMSKNYLKDNKVKLGEFNEKIYNKFAKFLISKKIIKKQLKIANTYTNKFLK